MGKWVQQEAPPLKNIDPRLKMLRITNTFYYEFLPTKAKMKVK